MNRAMSVNVPVTDQNGEVINHPDAKKIRRLLVKDLLRDNLVRVQYVRSAPYDQVHKDYDEDGINVIGSTVVRSKGDPRGVVVSQVVNGRLYIGWSLLHRNDAGKYDRDFGIMSAMNRMAPLESYFNNKNVPNDIRKTMAHLMARNVLYFKGK